MADIAFFSYLSTHCLTATWMSFPSLLTTSVQVFSPERQKHKCQKVKNRETCSAERRSGMHEQYPSNSSPLSSLPRRRVQHPASASVSAWAPHRGRRRRRRKSRRRNLGLAAAPGRFLQTFPRLNHSICSARPRRSRLPKPYPSSEHRAPAIRSVRKEFKGRKDSWYRNHRRKKKKPEEEKGGATDRSADGCLRGHRSILHHWSSKLRANSKEKPRTSRKNSNQPEDSTALASPDQKPTITEVPSPSDQQRKPSNSWNLREPVKPLFPFPALHWHDTTRPRPGSRFRIPADPVKTGSEPMHPLRGPARKMSTRLVSFGFQTEPILPVKGRIRTDMTIKGSRV